MQKPEVRSARSATVGQQKPTKKVTREELSKQLKKMRDRDSEMVTGVFKNLENPAHAGGRGALCFSFKQYPGDEYVQYELLDGERYTLPRGVARHLNNNCFYREYQHLPGEFGKAGVREAQDPNGRMETTKFQMSRKVHRFAFHSLEYMDDDAEMMPADIVEVTAAL